jgi:aldehyde dehydrogenase (NAD+)
MSKFADVLSKLDIQPMNPGGGIGDALWSPEGSTILDSFSPIDEQCIGSIQTCGVKEYEQLMSHAKKASEEWGTWPAPKRGEIIRQIGNVLREHKNDLGSLVSIEMGKSLQEGCGEVQEMIDMADFAVGQSRMLYGKSMHSERPNHRMMEQWHPYGIIGVISAFNFPVAVWAWNAFLAAICGNVTIWKPSSKTPLCAVAVHKLCQRVLKANKAPAIFGYFIAENREVAELLVKDTRVPLISFTGSTYAGRHVGEVLSQRFGKAILELGGNNAIIIDETADLNLAIPAVVFGAVGTAGQRCTSTRRLFVHESRMETVLEKLKYAYKQITIGDPLDSSNLMGPLIDQDAVKIYNAAIDEIKSSGGHIAFGGHALKRAGYYVEPTIVAQLSNRSSIVQKETFAPILYVISFKNLKEAIAMQNDVPQGLSSALFTQSLKASELYLSAQGSDCGIANINIGTSGAEIGGAFGGEKETGGGRESGSDAWKGYMRRQTNTINWGDSLPLAQGIKFTI